MLRLALLCCVLLGGLAARAAHASAQATTAPAAAINNDDACADLPEGEAHARALALEAEVEPHVPAAARWWWGWLATYAALTVGQVVIALAVERDETRWPYIVGAVSAALGAGGIVISEVKTHRLSARFRELGPLTGNARLRAVEREVARAADGEDEARNLLSHALGWGCALGEGLVLWLGFDQLVDGLVSLAEGVAVSELQIAMTPTSARDAWHAHVAQYPDAARCLRERDESSARAPLPEPRLALVPAGLGAGLVLTF
jgi:hypothetical protein